MSEAELLQAHNSVVAIDDIRAERNRQISVEGWSLEHDDAHVSGELAMAASCYADPVNWGPVQKPMHRLSNDDVPPDGWPWDAQWFKPKSPRRSLVLAAALIIAEIERLDRAEGAQS